MRLYYPKGPISVGVGIPQSKKNRLKSVAHKKNHKSYGSLAMVTIYCQIIGP